MPQTDRVVKETKFYGTGLKTYTTSFIDTQLETDK